MSTIRLHGICASPGLARGRVVLLEEEGGAITSDHREADREGVRLRGVVDTACDQLANLVERTPDSGAQTLLAFQIAMLRDSVVTDPAFAAIAAGAGAEHAWRDAMELQIQQYDSATDTYFRARAADLRDMRDRVLRLLSGASATPVAPGSIVVATDLPPSRFLEIEWQGGGVALRSGSAQSHVAMLARARGVPMLIGLEAAGLGGQPDALLDAARLAGPPEALLDAENGALIVSPGAAEVAEFNARQQARRAARAVTDRHIGGPAVTADGTRVQLLINVADVAELASLEPSLCDGIGLVRTELLLRSAPDLTDESRQYEAYSRIVQWAAGRPVTIRLLDAGGDKPIPGYTLDGESNPFLGVRGVRLSLRHLEVLNTQLRALARAAALGPLQIMVPMITSPQELKAVQRQLWWAVETLARQGLDHRQPALGMMIEVPAAALTLDLFEAEFVSIGSNDLIQYLTACGRDSAPLAALQDPLQPAVLRLMREIVVQANALGIPISLCGDMASEPNCIAALLGMGLRTLSVAPAALGRIKEAIARYRIE